MKIYLQNILPQLQNFGLSLDKTAILINKPWALIDEDSEIQKLIFKKDKELILSKNGKVTIGKWDYFPEAKSLLIDRGTDKILCNEAMVDEGVLVMKLDGTSNQLFVLANENIIPDLDVKNYLINLRRRKLSLNVKTLCDGRSIEIAQNDKGNTGTGSRVTIDAESVKDGKYKIATSNEYIEVGENIILKVLTEEKHTNPDGKDIIIQFHGDTWPKDGDYVFVDGLQVKDGTIKFSKSKNLIVSDGKIVRIEMKNTIAKIILYVLMGILIIFMLFAIISK